MTPLQREDIIKYLIKIQLNFENAYRASNDMERELLLESWYEALSGYPKEACDAAVNNCLKNAKFAPRLGDITEEVEKLLSPEAKSDEELWAELLSVTDRVFDISRYLSYPQYLKWANEKLEKIYSELDEDLKLYVVNLSTLIEISAMGADTLQYERSRFFKQMPVLRKHRAAKSAAQRFLKQSSSPAALNGEAKQLPNSNGKK